MSSGKHYYYLLRPVIIVLLCVILFFVFLFPKLEGMYWVTLIIFAPLIVFQLLPFVILYYGYYKKDYGKEVVLDYGNSKFIINENGNESVLEFDEVKKVVKYSRDSKIDWGIPFWFWSSFYYIVIQTKEGKEFVVTCLTLVKVENFPLEVVRIHKIIPFIFLRGKSLNFMDVIEKIIIWLRG